MGIPRNSSSSLDDLYPPLFYPPDFQSPYTVPDRHSTTQDNPGSKSTTTENSIVTTDDEDKNNEDNKEKNCHGKQKFHTHMGLDEWCQTNCRQSPKYCPPTHCICE